MFVVVIFHLFYVLVKICVVFVVELNIKVIPVKYRWELTLTCYELESNISTKQYNMHPLQNLNIFTFTNKLKNDIIKVSFYNNC